MSVDNETCLGVALLQVQGVDIYGLLDTRAALNVTFFQSVKYLHLKVEQSLKTSTVANGATSGVLGIAKDILVSSKNIEARLHFVVLKNDPSDLVIGLSMLKGLGGVLDFRSKKACFAYHI